jgi:transcriptional regulator with XRE-family HTH domain
MPELSPSPIGRLLREWRAARGKSQLALALHAGVSTRHLSFVETGRASPSREMVLLLAQALDMPLRERNALLSSAGYAPLFSETPLAAPEMDRVRLALEAILRAHQRSPTVVVNRRCDILMANQAAQRLMAHLLPPEGLALASNIVRLIFSPAGARPFIENWDEVASEIGFRLRRESPTDLEDPLRAIVGPDVELPRTLSLPTAVTPTRGTAIALPIRIRKGALRLDLFSTITTFGTPLDVTAQELRLESMFPADAASERALDAICLPET